MFAGVLSDVKKSKVALQPIYEAFTNALEAIRIRESLEGKYGGEVRVKISMDENLTGTPEFRSMSISDNGIGFNYDEFKRFNTYKDFTKGFKNLGSGRIQYAHYFHDTQVLSRFIDQGKLHERSFVISKDDQFIRQNAIVYHKYCKEVENLDIGTTVTFNTLLESSNLYNKLTADDFKSNVLSRYMHYFCYNKSKLPNISIVYYVLGEKKGEEVIMPSDIPNIDKSEIIELNYSRISNNGRSTEKLDATEKFVIDAFKISSGFLKENRLNLVSKGEIVEQSPVTLKVLGANDVIDSSKYIFLVSSDYIDLKDTNTRGELDIVSKDSLTKHPNLFSSEEIFVEDIQEGVNESLVKMYPEIKRVKEEHDEGLAKLKKMFLLDEETAKSIQVSVNDSESRILEKFYEAEAKKVASLDADIKATVDKLDRLDTTAENYSDELKREVEKVVQAIPLQNKTSLTHYVARRKIVLELFGKILNRQLAVQNSDSRNMDEKLLHNLIFQQTTRKPEDSDLWLVNEDFVYFQGTSEQKLKDIKIDGQSLIKDDLEEHEARFIKSLNRDRLAKRPDILLFPIESKCIIIEFKNPDVDAAEHLTQINNYASLIWNLGNPKLKFTTFYGFLIGESINAIDVRLHDGEFLEAYNFDYLYRPHKLIPGVFFSGDASLYTEVIKYSTLLERAIKRNEIFIQKLTK